MTQIYRIRYIPDETVNLTADQILFRDENYLITKWKPIKPRKDIFGGISCVFIKEGWKISGMLDADNQVLYWYCDIIDIDYDREKDIYYLRDLLTDIVIKPGERVEVIDLDELAAAYEEGLITREQLLMSLKISNRLLVKIYKEAYSEQVLDIIKSHTGWECKRWQLT